MIGQIIFAVVASAALFVALRQFLKIRRNIVLGEPDERPLDRGQSWRNVLLVAFGQKNMFKNWLPAIFHFFIYAAFLITQVELIEIFIDGITGQHRIFWPSLSGFYTFVISFIEILSVLALIATVIFLIRRNVLSIPRFKKPEMKGWPFQDANIILYAEIALIFFIFLMNGADMALNDGKYNFAVSQYLTPLFSGYSEGALHTMERVGWWGHFLVVLGFLNYLPYSKHLHIIFAFPNTYYARQEAPGEMENMPAIMNEVKSMMGLTETADNNDMSMEEDLPDFGANDIFGLSQRTLLGAYACTECGRCTAQCPANLTGKKLSPRKIMMDIRDRAAEVGRKIDSGSEEYAVDKSKPLDKDNFDDGKNLFDYITREELHACTTCNACVEACPVLINPLEPILSMRRYEILTLSEGPQEWVPMFTAIENTGAVWSMPQDRDQWAKELNNNGQ